MKRKSWISFLTMIEYPPEAKMNRFRLFSLDFMP